MPSSQGVYAISVVSEFVGVGVQTLRLYERKGLVTPQRTDGGTRRYSEADVVRLKRIGELVDAGLNLAGIAMVLELETSNARLRAQATKLKQNASHEWDDDVAKRAGTGRRSSARKSGRAS
jgi:DNA-binding transcriptional MerR regulator